jgi:hypothetical protein
VPGAIFKGVEVRVGDHQACGFVDRDDLSW